MEGSLGPSLMSNNRLSNLTIVVVEDHDDTRRFLGKFLGCLGANVVLARNAVEGVEAVKTSRPNLVLCDIKMPGQDGFDVLSEIRAIGPGCWRQCSGYRYVRFSHARKRAYARLPGMLGEAVHSRQVTGDDSDCTLLTVLND